MAHIPTPAEMMKRVAFWKDLRPSRRAFVDSVLPGGDREIFNVIGRGVTEDAQSDVAIEDARDFHVTLVRAQPGNGSALHAHKTLEVFVPLAGRWAIQWGEAGEHAIEIGPWDTASVPTGVMRGFRNVGTEEGVLLVILGGTDPGKVAWAPAVLAAARARGVALDADGNVIDAPA